MTNISDVKVEQCDEVRAYASEIREIAGMLAHLPDGPTRWKQYRLAAIADYLSRLAASSAQVGEGRPYIPPPVVCTNCGKAGAVQCRHMRPKTAPSIPALDREALAREVLAKYMSSPAHAVCTISEAVKAMLAFADRIKGDRP